MAFSLVFPRSVLLLPCVPTRASAALAFFRLAKFTSRFLIRANRLIRAFPVCKDRERDVKGT
jgi:hypothetical protein